MGTINHSVTNRPYFISILWILYFYIIFFNPNLIFLGSFMVKIIYPIGIIVILANLKSYRKIQLRNLILIYIGLIILIYNIILHLICNQENDIFKGSVNFFLSIIIIPGFTVLLTKDYSYNQIITLIIKTGVLACCISLFCFIFPEINFILREYQFKGNDILLDIDYRGFGISNGLFFYYPIILCFILIFIFESNRNIVYKFIFFLIFLSVIMINARIGFVPLLLWILYKCIRSIKVLIYTIVGVILGIIALYYLYTYYDGTTIGFIFKWILGGIGQITNGIFGTNFDTMGESHLQTLSNDSVLTGLGFTDFVFGTGYNIYLGGNGSSTDTGYIVQLYYGGIIYLWGLLSTTCYISYKIYKNTNIPKNSLISFIILGTVLLSNIKGDFFLQMNNGFIFILQYYLITLNAKKNDQTFSINNNSRL